MGKKITHEEFKKDVESHNYILKSQFTGTSKNITLAHYTETGEYHEYTTVAKLWRKGCRCPICNKQRLSDKNSNPNFKSEEKFKQDLFEKYGDEYELISKYTNNKDKHIFRHNLDNGESHEFEMRAGDLLNNNIKCNKCAKHHKRNTEEFKKEVKELTKGTIYEDQIEILSEYVNSKTKIKFKHLSCGRIFEMRPDDFKNGNQRCPYCSKSKGEDKIVIYLESHNIVYIREYRINDCKNKRPLPFDFAIFDNNGNLLLLIEFDGEQHFTDRYFGHDSYINTITNDNIKNKYCNDNNIPLLRIKYNEINNIDNILNENLKILY